MIVCGIELRSSEAVLALVNLAADGSAQHRETETKRIAIGSDQSCVEVRAFADTIKIFFEEKQIDKIAIKSRAHKGKFAGGAVSFKLEAIIQMISNVDIDFVSPQALAKFKVELPVTLNNYQHTAFSVAAFSLKNA